MSDEDDLRARVFERGDPDDDPALALTLSDQALERGDLQLAAAALDRAYGLRPLDEYIAQQRMRVLDQLTIHEHGLVFRYVPIGPFIMGSTTGDADEQPAHLVSTGPYWLSDTPVTLALWRLLVGAKDTTDQFTAMLEAKIRNGYSATRMPWRTNARPITSGGDFDVRPMVAVSFASAKLLGDTLTTSVVEYGLPTEAEWEKAARGGLIGRRYSWGDAPPDPSRCDSGHFGEFYVQAPRLLPPNGYGLYGMCGGVWEWTLDLYDALAYQPARPPRPADTPVEHVLRGGSFSDCAEAITVSFRAPRGSQPRDHLSPNIGFRLCRRGPFVATTAPQPTEPVTAAPGPVEKPRPVVAKLPSAVRTAERAVAEKKPWWWPF